MSKEEARPQPKAAQDARELDEIIKAADDVAMHWRAIDNEPDFSHNAKNAEHVLAYLKCLASAREQGLPCAASAPMGEHESCYNYECDAFDPDCEHNCAGTISGEDYSSVPACEECLEYKQPCRAVAKLRCETNARAEVAEHKIEEMRKALDEWGCAHDHPALLEEIGALIDLGVIPIKPRAAILTDSDDMEVKP
jgi:hypothetical protein